jgi:hypothetical protein
MRKVIRIDETGMFIEDVILQNTDKTPDDCIEIPCPDGFYCPKLDGDKWVEGLTEAQISVILLKQPKQMLTIEQMDSLLTFLFEGREVVEHGQL